MADQNATGINQDGIDALHKLLQASFGVNASGPPKVEPVTTGGRNASTHLVATYASGLKIGLKAAEGFHVGTQREHAVSRIAEVLEVIGHCPALRCDPIPGLGPLRDKCFLATRWNRGRNLDQLSPEALAAIRRAPQRFLEAYGEWLAVGLLCGTDDNKSTHWVWDEQNQHLSRVDNEDSLRGVTRQPSEFNPPLATLGVLERVRAEGTSEREAVKTGLRRIALRLQDRKERVLEIVNSPGLTVSSAWMDKAPDDFVQQAVAGL